MGRSCLAHNLRRATRVISAHYDNAFKAAGLKSTQVSVLATIRGMTEEGQVCRMSSLAKVTRMDVSTLTRNLAVLERDSLIVIDTDNNDRRVR
ncbi:MAG: MarR family transcriptional regulator, partial [Candidatus Competibacteraceae bacterium]|nr:MarR family transcriptional regulator [Candidatus Competibacteraceae bacterium]